MTAPVILDGLSGLGALAELRGGLVQALGTIHRRHGPLVVLPYPRHGRLDGGRLTLVADAKVARAVLMAPARFASAGVYPRLGPPGCPHRRLREGIILAQGDAHADQRQRLLPALGPAAVEAMRPRLMAICRQEVAGWPGGRLVDLMPMIKRLLRRASLELLFGETDLTLGLEVGAALERHADLSFSVQALLAPLDLPGLDYRKLMAAASEVEAALARWIASRRTRPPDGEALGELPWGPALSDQAAAAQLWTLYGATYHTLTAALGWLLVLLAQHPDEAERLSAALADRDRADSAPPRIVHDAIWEAMRLATPVPFQVREAAGEQTLPSTDLPLADRDIIILSAMLINRGPAFGPEPAAFRPARWAKLGAPAQAELLVFSAGPRTCPGRAFALEVLAAALTAVWERWRPRLSPGQRIDYRTAITMSVRRARVILAAPDQAFRAAPVAGSAVRIAPGLAGREPQTF